MDQTPQPPMGAQQPQSILNAVRLMYVGAALSVLGVVLTFVQSDETRRQIIEDNPKFSKEDVDGVMAFGVVFGLVVAGLWLWMAIANGKGKTWARTTATVLGGLNVVFALVGLGAGSQLAGQTAMNVVGLGLAVAILVLLYRPDANQYYVVMSGRTGY